MEVSILAPVRASHAVRWRPIRAGIDTVPPAPGMRPIETSGNRKVVSEAAVNSEAKDASSTPAPTQAPCTRAVDAVAERQKVRRSVGRAADLVSSGWVGNDAELGEIAAGAEGLACTAQFDPDRRISLRHDKCIDQSVSHGGVVEVVETRPV